MEEIETIEHYHERLDNIQFEVNTMKEKMEELESETKEILEKIAIRQSYHTINDLPNEIQNLGIYIPKKFQLYKNDLSFFEYVLKYDDIMFTGMLHDVLAETIAINKFAYNEKNKSLLEQIYFKPTEKVFIIYEKAEMNNLQESIEKAKEIIMDKWNDRLSFGIAVFHYWIKFYCKKNCDDKKFYNMFEHEI